jgi:group I intron endonuclease
VAIPKSKSKTGFQVRLCFNLTQHSRDTLLFRIIRKYLECGEIIVVSNKPVVRFNVTKFSDIINLIIPFFDKYPLLGNKRLDYADFVKVAALIEDKAHLTVEGLEEIREIKARMNTNRINVTHQPPDLRAHKKLLPLLNIENSVMSFKLSNILKKHNIRPLAVFENLHLAKSRDQAKDCLKDLAGIYMVVNIVDGSSFYIGSATTNRLHTRLMNHLYYLKGNSRIVASVKLLGRKNFAFVVLDIFPEKVTDKTNFTLLSLEQYYIDLLKPKYNILQLAGNSFGFKHTPETIQKMRDNYSDIRRDRIGNLNRGKSLSQHTRELLRQAALSRPPYVSRI